MIEVSEELFDSMFAWVVGASNYCNYQQKQGVVQYNLLINGKEVAALRYERKANSDFVYLSNEDLYKLYRKQNNYTIEF